MQWHIDVWRTGGHSRSFTKENLETFPYSGMSRMKALVQSYVYWLGKDKGIVNMVKSYRSCASAAKAPPIKFNLWPKTDKPWSRLQYWLWRSDKRNIPFCHSRQLYEITRSFQIQNAHDKKQNKGVTGTVCKIRIARNHCIWQWHTIYIKKNLKISVNCSR